MIKSWKSPNRLWRSCSIFQSSASYSRPSLDATIAEKNHVLFSQTYLFSVYVSQFFFYFFPRFSFVFPFSKFCYPPMLPFFKKIILFGNSHRRCSVKKVFLKGSQYLQENTCVWSLFLTKLQAYWIWLLMLQISNCCQSNYKDMENSCSPMTFSDQIIPLLTRIIFSKVSFMNLHLKMYNFLLFAPVGSTSINMYSVSLPQGFFVCCSNATTTVQIVPFLYIRMRRHFVSFVFIFRVVLT